MVKGIVKWVLRIGFLAVAAYLAPTAAPKIWAYIKDRPPSEVFASMITGALIGAVGLSWISRIFDWWKARKPRKTDPVIGTAPAPMKTYEEWREDLDKAEGIDGLDAFLEKWSEVPRTKKGEAAPKRSQGSVGLQGKVEVSGTGLPEDVVKWIDKHYERAAQLWVRAHPGQNLPRV